MGMFDDWFRDQLAKRLAAPVSAVEEMRKKMAASSEAGKKLGNGSTPVVSNPFAGLNPGGSTQSGPKGLSEPGLTRVNPSPQQQVPTFNNAPQLDTNQDDLLNNDAIWDRLGQNFDFGGARNSVDTSDYDRAIQARMALIDQAKGNANSNFATSDANIKSMHDAVVNDTRAQAPNIQSSFDKSGETIKQIFGDTINQNNTQQAAQQSSREEMLQRLGIAPAAGAPDIVGEQFARSNAAANQSQDARLAENVSQGQVAQDRNNNFANAVNAEGVGRRSNLNLQLQDILGKLDSQGADYQNEAMNRKSDFANSQVDKSYERFLQDRNFDMSQLQERNNYNIGLEQARGKAAADSAKNDSSVTGFDGLWGQTPDSVKKAVMGIQGKVNIDREPDKAWKEIQKLAQKDPSINLDEAYQYLQKRATLGTTNKFATQ